VDRDVRDAVRSVAPVGDRVYAATDGGRLGVVS
jgi:hypothetical protein